MQYRRLSKKIDFMPSVLGFGLMRLPLRADNTVDIDEAVRIVRYSIDNGLNYLDTAYAYHQGESEKILSQILKDGYREKVKIADKFPVWLLKDESDLDRYFFEQLEKLKVEKIDFYLLHALDRGRFSHVLKFKIIDWLEKKKADGFIDYIGFSFHDKLSCLKKIVDYYEWDFCQIQFNLVDIKTQISLKGLQYAKNKDIGIIIMEPLRGGQLTLSIPDDIRILWDKMAKLYGLKEYNPVQFMLDWIWNFEETGLILSGMSNFEQVKENLSYADSSAVNKLTKEQLKLFNQIQKAYLQKIIINCTSCNYCKVCPEKIAIPYIFNLVNEINRFDNTKTPAFRYNFLSDEQKAGKCTDCKVCIQHCPQKLDIPELLDKSRMIFEEKKDFNEVF